MFEGSHMRYWIDTGQVVLVIDDADTRRDCPLKSRVAVELVPEGFHILGDRLAS
jgi:hypothetical protein